MVLVGRYLITVGILAFLLALALTADREWLAREPAAFQAFKTAALIVPPTLLGAWVLAIYHWATRYPGDPRGKGRWGVVVVLGMFVGAFVYWWWGGHRHGRDISSSNRHRS